MEDIHNISSQDAFSIVYAMISDIIEIVIKDDNKILGELTQICRQKLNLENADEITLKNNNILLRAELFEQLLKYYKKQIRPDILELYMLSIKSFKTLINEEKFDMISDRNAVSLIVFSYCLIAYFKYFLAKDIKPMKVFQKDIFVHILGVINRDNSLKQKYFGKIINIFLNKEWQMKGKSKDDIIYSILYSAKQKDFKPDYDNYTTDNENNNSESKNNPKVEVKNKEIKNIINEKEEEKVKKEDKEYNKNIGPEEQKSKIQKQIERIEYDKTSSEIFENENKKARSKNSENNIKNKDNNIDSNSSENDTKGETIDDDTILNLINCYQGDPKLKAIFMAINNTINLHKNKIGILESEVISLKAENKEIINNQIALWNLFQMICNGRDIFKNIVFYFYEYLGLKGNEINNYSKLSSILNALKDNKCTDKITNDNDVDATKLCRFFYLDFFLNKLCNKVVHRQLKYKSDEANRKAKLIPSYTFEEAFNNIILFINKTINDDDLQNIIKETIEDYKNDTKIEEILKYDENNLFSKVNNGYRCLLEETDINNIKDFLKDLLIKDKKFWELCETNNSMKGIDEEGLILPKPIFCFKGKSLDL